MAAVVGVTSMEGKKAEFCRLMESAAAHAQLCNLKELKAIFVDAFRIDYNPRDAENVECLT